MKKSNKTIYAVDLFCGAGGTSTGLKQACEAKGYNLELTAINHWNTAIATHKANHPESVHLCEDLDNVNPRHVVPRGRLDLLWASPACTHHSNARGGKPMEEQSRSSAWVVLRWAEAIYIDAIALENVKEFRDWGPIGADGRPLKSKKGETFQAFIRALESLGYRVEWKLLTAANYGDPTTRERLFIQARRGNKKIVWPEITHTQRGETNLFGGTERWRSAAEIIDWSIPSQSIFTRKKPLKPNTLRRIAVGLKKYGLAPFITPNFGERGEQQPRSRGLNTPTLTVTSRGAGNLVTPFLVKYFGGHHAESLNKPLPTVTANYEHYGLIEPFLVELRNNSDIRKLSAPLSTITTQTHHAICQPFIVNAAHGEDAHPGRRALSLDRPLQTITAGANGFALAQPFILKYNRTATAYSTNSPLDTVTTNDRFGLVQPLIDLGNGLAMDLHFRMLQPSELAKAQGFEGYHFEGTKKEIVKQIGNAVPVNLARALCSTLI